MKNYFLALLLLGSITFFACNNQSETRRVNDTTVIEGSSEPATPGSAIPENSINQKDSAILRSDTTSMSN